MVIRGSEGCIALGTLPLSRLIARPETGGLVGASNTEELAGLPETIVTEHMETLGQDRILPLHFT